MPSCRVPVRCLEEGDLRVVARSSAYAELRMARLSIDHRRLRGEEDKEQTICNASQA